MNRTEISARLVERSLLRFTPAGLPVSECVLQHASRQIEARLEREVELELATVAIGEIAHALDQAALGARYRFRGFLAQRRRNSKSVVYHIIEFELERED